MNEKTYTAFLNFLKENNFQRKLNHLAKKYKNKKVIIYGTGFCFDVVNENFNLSEINIIGISDIKFNDNTDSDIKNYKNYIIIKPSEIAAYNPDVIFIFTQEYFRIENYFEKTLFKNEKLFNYESVFKYSITEIILGFLLNNKWLKILFNK